MFNSKSYIRLSQSEVNLHKFCKSYFSSVKLVVCLRYYLKFFCSVYNDVIKNRKKSWDHYRQEHNLLFPLSSCVVLSLAWKRQICCYHVQVRKQASKQTNKRQEFWPYKTYTMSCLMINRTWVFHSFSEFEQIILGTYLNLDLTSKIHIWKLWTSCPLPLQQSSLGFLTLEYFSKVLSQ